MRMPQTGYLGLLLSLLLALGIALAASSVAWAQGQFNPWTTVASAGTVDEASVNDVILEGSFATLRGHGTATIRYNIVAVDDVTGGAPYMEVRFRDSGDRDRVLVELKEVNLTSGAETTVVVLDSNNYKPDLLVQSQFVFNCGAGFNFSNNAYYIQATLIRELPQASQTPPGSTRPPGGFRLEDRPALQTIKVLGSLC